MKKESEGNTITVRSLRQFGFFAYKISDVQGTRFTETKPCDIIACSPNGTFIAIEGKLFKKWQKLDKDVLRPNQIKALDEISYKRNGRAFVFLYVSIKSTKKTKGFEGLVVFEWRKHRDVILSPGGIPPTDLRNHAYGVKVLPYKVGSQTFYPITYIL